ncbi:hypothetical protein ACIGW7_19055 [Streptomyces sp. NPDC053253]|uniref:hypothetical protein n=1 Tax=Streptomyces sp. NPDC053253 TaxID=3365699 RepID=UPI0037CD99D7
MPCGTPCAPQGAGATSTVSPDSPSGTCAPATSSTSPTASFTSSASTTSPPSTPSPPRPGALTERNLSLNFPDVAGSLTRITLFTSDRTGIVGLVDGSNWRWARHALELSGFKKNDGGNLALPLSDLAHARETLLALRTLAEQALDLRLTPSSDRYIGDFALDVTEHLPGQWTARVENYAIPVWQEDLTACLWGTGTISHTLAGHRVVQAAILHRGDGTELAVVKDPRLDVYHVGALQPRHAPGPVTTPGPPGVTVRPTPSAAAHTITTRLLPSYTRAVLQAHAADLSDDLTWARETYEAGTIPNPVPWDLADAYGRFAAAAPIVIAAICELGTLNEHEASFLQEVESISTAPAPGSEPVPVSAHPDPLGWWLLEGGDGLIDLAMRAVDNVTLATGQARLAASPTLALPSASAPSEPNGRRR